MKTVKELREKADTLVFSRGVAKATWKQAIKDVNDGEEELSAADEAQQIVQTLAETIQQEAHSRISGVVSRCLATVFDEPYEFRIRFERARGRTEAHLVFVRDGQEINPMDAAGGGVVDVAGFAQRVSCLMLSRPARRRAIILDEPFKFVSADKRHRVRSMMENLTAELGIQFIQVTHIDELRCGTIIDLG